MTVAQIILLLLLGAAAFQTLHYYPLLPEVVASQFNASGTPNNWSSRAAFFALYWGLVGVMVAGFYVLPLVLRHFPGSINIPNREYWLVPERREATLALLSSKMNWFGNATIALLAWTIQLVIQTNLQGSPSLPAAQVFLLMGVFFAFVLGWVIQLYRSFARPS